MPKLLKQESLICGMLQGTDAESSAFEYSSPDIAKKWWTNQVTIFLNQIVTPVSVRQSM